MALAHAHPQCSVYMYVVRPNSLEVITTYCNQYCSLKIILLQATKADKGTWLYRIIPLLKMILWFKPTAKI